MLAIEIKLNEAVTAEQTANLQTLADYLETLPPDYSCFAVESYTDFADFPAEATIVSCGTVASLAGHGPAAGIPAMSETESWHSYSGRVFGAYAGRAHNNDVLHWLFSPYWSLPFPEVRPAGVSAEEMILAVRNLEFRQARCRLLYSLENNLLPRCDAANIVEYLIMECLTAYAEQKIEDYPEELIFPNDQLEEKA